MPQALRKIMVGPLPVPTQIGEAAIAMSAITLLRTHLPQATIVGWSNVPLAPGSPALQGFLDTYKVDSVAFSPSLGVPNVRAPSSAARALCFAACGYTAAGLTTLFRKHVKRLPPLGAWLRLVKEISECDLVVMRGGGSLTSPHVLCDLLSLRLESLNEVSLARTLGVPYAIWGHSVWDLNGPLAKRFLLPLVRDGAVTVCREQLSLEYLVSLGAPAHKLALLPDTAFGVVPAGEHRIDEIMCAEGLQVSRAPLVGVNVRPLYDVRCNTEELTRRYLIAVAQAIRHVHADYGMKIVLVSHCHDAPPFRVPRDRNDREAQAPILRLLGNPCWVRTVTGNYSPQELAGVYGRLRLVLTTRLHTAILAAVAGTPSALIAYSKHKHRGVARMLGLEEFVIDIESLTAERLVALLDALMRARDDVVNRLRKRVLATRSELEAIRSFDAIRHWAETPGAGWLIPPKRWSLRQLAWKGRGEGGVRTGLQPGDSKRAPAKEYVMMRVLHVHGPLVVGGIETWLTRLPAYMPPDVELHYVLLKDRGPLAEEAERNGAKVHVVRAPWFVPKALYYPAALAAIVRRVEPDMIHAHSVLSLPVAVIGRALARRGVPVIFHVHGPGAMGIPRVARVMARWALRHTDLALCVSDGVERSFFQRYRAEPRSAQVLYCGIPLEPFRDLPDRQSCRLRLGLDPYAKVAVFVGRLAADHKGLDVLLGAVACLRKRGRDLVLLLVGGGPDEQALRQRADRCGIGDAVRFLAVWRNPDVLVPLCAADVFVHPSRWEGLPLAVVEASAAGLPVVATNVGGIPEAVEDEVTGLLVPPEDPQALVSGIKWMFENPEERRRMGQADRRLAYQRFDMRRAMAELAELYRELAARPRRG